MGWENEVNKKMFMNDAIFRQMLGISHFHTASHDYGAAYADWTLNNMEQFATELVATNASQAANIVALPTKGKFFIIVNTSGFTLTLKASGVAGFAILNATTVLAKTNAAGTDFVALTTIAATISGATVDNSVIGGTTPAAGTFTTLTPTSLIGPAPVAVGATKTLTAANAGQTALLNTVGGSVATLPAATGTGNKFKFVVSASTTSAAHKILAASVSDFIIGIATGQNANTAKVFASPLATNHSLQMPFSGTQPSGGIVGDWFELTDIAANLWYCNGMYSAGTTPTTPFNSATS